MVSISPSLPPPGHWRCWWLAARPKTLPTALAPVLLGSALAWQSASFHALVACCALGGALALQIGSNFANDYFDARQGADTQERLGPPRAVALGLLTSSAMWRAMVGTFLVAAAFGSFLVLRAGWPLVLLGFTAIACAVLYTAGRYSLASLGLGDVFAFLFFGPVAVAGTYYVQTLTLTPLAIALGIVPGCYAVALLAINNLRDHAGDAAAGKRTLAVRFGPRFVRGEILGALLLPVAAPWFLPHLPIQVATVGSLVILVAARPILFPIWRGLDGRPLNALLPRVSAANLCVSFLLSVFLVRSSLFL